MLLFPLTLALTTVSIFVDGTKYARRVRVIGDGLEVHETTDFSRLFVSELLDGELIDCREVTDIGELSYRIPSLNSSNDDVESEDDVGDQPFITVFSQCKHQSRARNNRQKRSMMILPGTQWCGSGHKADHAHHTTSETDMCCRQHDSCPMFIKPGELKYGTRNYLPYTVSYCKCDLRFYSCLKRTESSTGNLLGRFFFNMLHNQCFDLEREKACVEWHLFGFGGCKKYGRKLVAEFRKLPRY
ncbi:hypothetical protein L596_023065 [Steinernema carpocapsae]|uniref:Phospholipase A2-like central domain-containing protein n=1 Tax=Steinernema carpocapsae TaxID=34508 RepID=A0A4U5MCH7_STECR|nr:hypothetical protein L596_023065 [Steinernema carpocapsae]